MRRSILMTLVITLVATLNACSDQSGRPTDTDVRGFATSRGMLVTETSPVVCARVVLHEEEGEATFIDDSGVPRPAPEGRLYRRYEYFCMVVTPGDYEPWGFVGKLRHGGRLVAVDVQMGTDETDE